MGKLNIDIKNLKMIIGEPLKELIEKIDLIKTQK